MSLHFPIINPENLDKVLTFLYQSNDILKFSDLYTHSTLSDTFTDGIASRFQLDNNRIGSNNRSFHGIFYSEVLEDSEVQPFIYSLVISLESFSNLLTAEVLRVNQQNPSLRRNLLRTAILNYCVNAYFTSNNCVHQEALTQEQYDQFKAKLASKPKEIDDVVADDFQTKKRDQQFDFTHALFLYAFSRVQEDTPEAEQILDTVYEFLFSYGFGAVFLGTYATIFVLLHKKLGFNLTQPLLQIKGFDNSSIYAQALYITHEYTSDNRGGTNTELAAIGRAWHLGKEENFATFAQSQTLIKIFDYIEFENFVTKLEKPLEEGSAPVTEQARQAFAGPIAEYFKTLKLVDADQALEAAKEINQDYLKALNVTAQQYQQLRLKNAKKLVNKDVVDQAKESKRQSDIRDGSSAYRKFIYLIIFGVVLALVLAFLNEI